MFYRLSVVKAAIAQIVYQYWPRTIRHTSYISEQRLDHTVSYRDHQAKPLSPQRNESIADKYLPTFTEWKDGINFAHICIIYNSISSHWVTTKSPVQTPFFLRLSHNKLPTFVGDWWNPTLYRLSRRWNLGLCHLWPLEVLCSFSNIWLSIRPLRLKMLSYIAVHILHYLGTNSKFGLLDCLIIT